MGNKNSHDDNPYSDSLGDKTNIINYSKIPESDESHEKNNIIYKVVVVEFLDSNNQGLLCVYVKGSTYPYFFPAKLSLLGRVYWKNTLRWGQRVAIGTSISCDRRIKTVEGIDVIQNERNNIYNGRPTAITIMVKTQPQDDIPSHGDLNKFHQRPICIHTSFIPNPQLCERFIDFLRASPPVDGCDEMIEALQLVVDSS